MSIKVRSLGSAGAVANCITCSSTTNATPIVATLGAGHGLKNGDKIAIAGITGNTNANGVWELASVGATTATLVGSSGNGVHGGTAIVGVVFDKTPHMKAHAGQLSMAAPGAVATVFIDAFANYADFALATQANAGGAEYPVQNPAWTNTNGNSTTTPASSSLALTAAVTGNGEEVKLSYILRARVSAYTSGQVTPRISC
jgi:hypothetical protein